MHHEPATRKRNLNAVNFEFKRMCTYPQPRLKHQVHHLKMQAISVKTPFHSAPQPNWAFNADANTGHGFAIFMASVGTLRTSCSGAG